MDEKLQKLKDWIAECDNIVFFGGAGVSTESGIPDFRGEKGIFTAVSEYGYRPEIILSHSFFEAHPDIFFQYYKKNLLYPDAKPNEVFRSATGRKWYLTASIPSAEIRRFADLT